LIKMQVDVGRAAHARRRHRRGLRADALVGRSVVNRRQPQTAKLMGVESNGMVLAASPGGGLPALPIRQPAAPGSRVR